MSADIADYTRLMGADQAGTMSALKWFRTEILRPGTASRSGEVIKDMGDGWLVEFSSVANAIGAALALQEALAGHPLLRLRIGVNIGDIVHEAEDIFGDGVNIAARLQAIAPIGGIALSGSAYNSLDGTVTSAFSNADLHELKNVSRRVQVWMRGPAAAVGSVAANGGAASGSLVRLAIKPISAPRNRPDFSDLADSISGDLLDLLNSAGWLAPRVASLTGDADYSLSALLRVRGDQVRMEVELSDALGEPIWSGAFDGFVSDQFAWQDRVTLEIASNVVGAVTDSERTRLFEKPLETLSARECLECAVFESSEISEDALTSTLGFIRRAIESKPDCSLVYVYGVRSLISALVAGQRDRLAPCLQDLPDWMEHLQKSEDHRIKLSLYRAIWRYVEDREPVPLHDGVSEVLLQAPMDPDVLCLAGWSWVWLGEPDRAIACFRKFEQIGRFNPLALLVRGGLAMALVQAGRDVAAKAESRNILRQTRDFSIPMLAMASASAHLGELDDARAAVADALRLSPQESIEGWRTRIGLADTGPNDRLNDGLRMAGFPGA